MNRPSLAAVTFALGAATTLVACCPTPAATAPTTPVVADRPPEPPPAPPIVAPAPPAVDWSAAGIDWTRPPPALPEIAFAPPVPTEFRLSSGARVLVVENHRLPLVSVRIAIASAGARGDKNLSGLAALTADLLDEGAGSRDAQALPEELERLGASLTVAAGMDYAQVTLDTLAETLAPSLAIAADVLMRPRLTTDDFSRVKAEHLADLELRADQPRAVASVVFAGLVFGTHPYGNPVDGAVATVAAIQKPDVVKFHRTMYGPAATTIVVVGDVTAADAKRQLEAALAGWKTKVSVPRPPRAPAPTAPTLAVVDRPGAPQSVVILGRLGPGVSDPDQAANDIVNTAVGGSFASRLNTELREKQGYTYGIGSQFVRGLWAGTWRATSSIRTDATGAAVRAALAIIAGAGAEPLPDAELAKTKALIIRGLPQDFETNAGIASSYLALAIDGRPLTYYRDLPARLAAVTGAAAEARAADAWHDLSIVVVGDWAAIGADLTKLGLPIVRFDASGARAK